MPRLELLSAVPPPIEEISFQSLFTSETYDAPTADGWVLQITRYKPVAQGFDQPLLDEPLLLIPGWSQNRTAYSNDFLKHLLYDGADVHILELRGHGLSSRELQLERAAKEQRKPPRDLDWDWDLDAYLLEDLPAGVRAVKAKTGHGRITLVGNSMGGMLGYGYAAQHKDLLALCTLAAPGALGRGYPALRLLASLGPPIIGPVVDAMFGVATQADRMRHRAAGLLRSFRWLDGAAERLSAAESGPPIPWRFNHIPVDRWLQMLSEVATPKNLVRFQRLQSIAQRMGSLLNPTRVAHEEILALLQHGGEKEPRKVVEQFARWIRSGRMTCERTGFDYQRGFAQIEVPLAVLYGDLDRLASRESTGVVVRAAASEYKLWRSVSENSHLELTMGADVQLSCESIRELVLFAKGSVEGPQARRRIPALRALAGVPF